MKRGRVDGGISREDYDAQVDASEPTPSGGLPRASEDVLRTRKIHGGALGVGNGHGVHNGHAAAHGSASSSSSSSTSVISATAARHWVALNDAFLKTLGTQWAHNKHGDWRENMREYVAYAREIERTLGARRGTLLTFGSGDCGQLAHGVDEDEDLMVPFPRPVAPLARFPVTRVMCGGLHTAAITADGEIYTWGCNDDGALGRSGDENIPARVAGFGPERCALLAVGGDSHTAVVTSSGHVWTWGSYKDKEGKQWCDSLAPKTSFKQNQAEPFQVKSLRNVVDIACGSSFNVVRTGDGHALSWGLGEMGQLGRPVNKEMKSVTDGVYDLEMVFREHLTPARMTLGGGGHTTTTAIHNNNNDSRLPPVKTIGCGSYHTMVVLSANGALYTCGLNNYGQLGLGHTDNQDALQLVDELATVNVARVDGGTHHSVVCTNDGAVFAFGRADSGQLGTMDECPTGAFKERPQRVTLSLTKSPMDSVSSPLKRARHPVRNEDEHGVDVVDMLACGSNHTLVCTEQGRIYSWGYGDMLALGHGNAEDENRPRALDWRNVKAFSSGAQVLQISAGGQHSAILATKK